MSLKAQAKFDDMGFSGSKISGFSGTELKHRKVFSNFRKVPSTQTEENTEPSKQKPREGNERLYSSRENKTGRWIWYFIVLPSTFLAVFLGGKLILFPHDPPPKVASSQKDPEEDQLLFCLIEKGESSLAENEVHEAYLYFRQALCEDKNDVTALEGMVESLRRKSEFQPVFHRDYEKTKAYLEKMSRKTMEKNKGQ